MHLGEIQKHEIVEIKHILLSDFDRLRLRQLGIMEGKKICLITTTLFHDPLLFQIEDNLIAIRTKDARNIIVERVKL